MELTGPSTTDTSTVTLTSTDANATFPATATLVAGKVTVSGVFKTAGSQTVSATGTLPVPSTSNAVTVTSGPLAKLVVTAPTTATAGTAVTNVSTMATDSYGNTVTSYTGTVHFTSTDPFAVLPADSALTAGALNSSVTFRTSGVQTVTATPVVAGPLPGTSGNVTVAATAAPAAKFTVTVPATAVAGTPVSITVNVRDASNNSTSTYAGTVHLTTTDSHATLPPDAKLMNGSGTFMVTFKTIGSFTVTATDTTTASITGTSDTVTVTGGGDTKTYVGSSSTAIAAAVLAGTTPATGSVDFTVNQHPVGTAMLVNGLAKLPYTLGTGTQRIVATYTGDDGFNSSTGTRTVTAPKVTTTQKSTYAKTPFGWYRSNVAVFFHCTKGSATLSGPCPTRTVLSATGKNVSVTKTVIAKDGGRTTVKVTVKIDKTKPIVKVTGTAPNLKCSATDALSGVASCTITRHTQGRTVKYTATAKDKAGNVARVSGHYKEVVA